MAGAGSSSTNVAPVPALRDKRGSCQESGFSSIGLATVCRGGPLSEMAIFANRQRAAHSGRGLHAFDVQFDVGRELAGVAVRALYSRRTLH